MSASERRSHPRAELFAQVQVSQDAEVHIMSTANLSLGGAFLLGDPEECPDLQVGVIVDLLIFAGEELDASDARVRGKILRIVREGAPAPGFGLRFLSPEAGEAAALERLIQAAG
jgi:hypothetical protein